MKSGTMLGYLTGQPEMVVQLTETEEDWKKIACMGKK